MTTGCDASGLAAEGSIARTVGTDGAGTDDGGGGDWQGIVAAYYMRRSELDL